MEIAPVISRYNDWQGEWMETRDLLEYNPVFSCLTMETLNDLVDGALLRHYHRGQYLAHAGDIWPMLFFLVTGGITAVKESPEGRSLVATSFGPGEVFWGISFFHPELPMPVALRVDRQTSVYLWSREQMLPVLTQHGMMSFELCRLMVSRMLRASEIVEELAFQPVAGRLARLLIDYPGQSGSGPVARSLTLDDMAARIGSTREVVCRFLQRFADQNLIKITRTEFEINDRGRLLEIIHKGKG
jgi:CRP/FNR family cyclic AMP-dependent transcriptional regulator